MPSQVNSAKKELQDEFSLIDRLIESRQIDMATIRLRALKEKLTGLEKRKSLPEVDMIKMEADLEKKLLSVTSQRPA